MDMGSMPYQTKTTGLLEYPIVINDPNYPSVEELVANVAGECEKSCSTDFDKAVWLHDWILDHAVTTIRTAIVRQRAFWRAEREPVSHITEPM